MTDYRVDVRDTAGALQFVLTDFTSLAYTKIVNAPGLLQIAMRGDHALMSTIADKWQLEVWRKPAGQVWARDFVAIYREPEWRHDGSPLVTLAAPGLLSMLSWRIVAWYAEVVSRTFFDGVVSETIMKTLVNYNACALATVANGRLREGAVTGLTCAVDGTAGNTVDWYCAYDNLLDTLQKLALIAGGDFDIVKTSSTAWQFRWYTGQLGTDRTASVKFSMALGNMASPVYRENRIGEATAAIVGGQGNLSAREIVIRTGANYNVTTNNIEIFAAATDVAYGNTAGLNSKGDGKLADTQANPTFTFDALQIPATLYGVDYFLGDLVTAINPYTDAALTQQVKSVTVSLGRDGSESIRPTFKVV